MLLDTITSVEELAMCLVDCDGVKEGKYLLETCLMKRKNVFGEDHVDTLECMDKMGRIYLAEAKYDESIEIHESRWEIKRRKFGDMHPSTLITEEYIGNAMDVKGDTDSAVKIFRDCLEKATENLGGESNPDILATMQKYVNAVGHLPLSDALHVEKLYEHCIGVSTNCLGENHLGTVVAKHFLGLFYQRQQVYRSD